MQPVNGWVLIAPKENESAGMLMVPESHGSDQLQIGTVVLIDEELSPKFEVGDTVFFSRNNIVWVRYHGDEHYFIKHTNINSYVKEQGQDQA